MEIHLKIKDVVGQDEKGRHIFLVNNEDLRDCILERKDWVLQEIVKEHLLKQPKAIAMILDDNDIRNTIYMQEKAKREEKSEKRERHRQFEIEARRRREQHQASVNYRKHVDYIRDILGWNEKE